MSENGPHYFRREWIESSDRVLEVDFCVYGGTSAGVAAAVTAARRGRSVVILNPARHVGGMTTGGLGWTDSGKQAVIGGLSRQFYRDLGALYGQEELWQFPPGAAMKVYERWLAEAGVPVHHRQFLDRTELAGGRIKAVRMLGGLTVRAAMFFDATYEGDLLAQAGVSYTVGREGNAVYGETLNGIQVRDQHQFSHPVDPYVKEGDPSSGTLPLVNPEDMMERQGEGDHRIQAYCFRMCMTDDPDLKIAWEKPADFDPKEYVLASRWFNSEKDFYNDQLMERDGTPLEVPRKFDILPNRTPGGYYKTDTNNHGPVSSDYIGANHDWPESDYEQRERIFQQHVTYQKGLYWFLANDPSIPQRYREAYSRWGLARDEFEDTANWPHQLYVREARRMVGDYVVSEHDCMGNARCDDPVGMGSYQLDSHNCQRFVHEGRVLNDGDVQVKPPGPYQISYRSIVPRAGECENLLAPCCVSASHIAFGSVRMEPVFMILGESAAIAADLALSEGAAVQQVPYASLRGELDKAGQVVEAPTEMRA